MHNKVYRHGKHASRQNTRQAKSTRGSSTNRTARTKAKHTRHVKRNRHLGRADQTRDESQGHESRPTPSRNSSHQTAVQKNKNRPRWFLFHPPTTGDCCRSREPHLPCTSLNFISPRNTVPYRYPSARGQKNQSFKGRPQPCKGKSDHGFFDSRFVCGFLLDPRQRELAELCPIPDCLPCYLQAGGRESVIL